MLCATAALGATSAPKVEKHEDQVARLNAEIAALRAQLASRSAVTEVDQIAADIRTAVAAESKFVPLAATNCFGVKPCMHSTAADRVGAGCHDAVWEGHFGERPTQYTLEVLGPPHNISYHKPVAPKVGEKFHPDVGDVCDLTDVWVVNRGGHVTDQTEAHWNQRLRGVKNSLWLNIGSSIDHGAMKEVRTAARPKALPPPLAPSPALARAHSTRVSAGMHLLQRTTEHRRGRAV